MPRPFRLMAAALHTGLPLLALDAWTAPAAAQPAAGGERPVIRAVRLEPGDSIQLDGHLEEAVWERAEPATGFRQQDPVNGEPATEHTEVRIAYDRNRLYVGLVAFDSEPRQVLGNQMQRDASFDSDDRFMLALDPYLDGRSGYYFEVNPAGAMGDGLVNPSSGPGGGVSRAWDGIWNARVRRTDSGWTAEIEIPFRTLNFDPGGPAWGINFQRTVRRKNEESLWTGFARNQGLTRMTSAGLLLGLEDLSQGLGLDVKPYAVANVTQAPGRGAPGSVFDGTMGADFFYNLTPGLRANVTVNTDFAETQVDQRIVNLTRFPVSLPERRDFFLEGSNFFDFAPAQVNPFFSRRIGLDAAGQPQGIDYGVKLTGQAGAHDIGALHLRTRGDEGQTGEDFTAVRARRRLLLESFVGMLYTRRAPRASGDPDLHTAGIDFGLATSRFRGSENLDLLGYYVWSTDPAGSGESASYGVRASFPNDPLNLRMSYREIQANHDPAVGFTPRRNVRRYNPGGDYSFRPTDHAWIRRLLVGTNIQLFTDVNNVVATRTFDVTLLQVDLHAGDRVTFSTIPSFERLERRFEIHPGVELPAGTAYAFTRYGTEFRSASNRPVALQLGYQDGPFLSGTRRELTAGFDVRPRTGILVNLSTERNDVDLPEGRFATRLYTLVANTQFNPWISLVNDVQYDSVSESVGWQLRWRWTLRPGNDVYFVYTHNWVDREEGLTTLDRRAAGKLAYTHRF